MVLLKSAGIAGIPLMVLTLVVAALILRAAWRGMHGRPVDLFSLLFWGFAAAVLGFLAQCAGLYNALTVIGEATAISPQVVARGFAQSFVTTLWGGSLLLLAGFAWAVLRALRWVSPQSAGR